MKLSVGRHALRWAVVGAAVTLVLAGCGFALRLAGPADEVTVVQITVSMPVEAQGIFTEQVDVTSLDLKVSGGSFLHEITWLPSDGLQQYDVSVPGAGSYEIEAVHHGVSAEGPISATETATIFVQPMVISVVRIIPGQILTLLVANFPVGRIDESRWDQAVFGP